VKNRFSSRTRPCLEWPPSGSDFPVEPSFQAGNEDFSSHPSGAQSDRFAAGPGLANINEIKRLCGGDLVVAAQANVQIDAEIGQKDHFRIKTRITLPLRLFFGKCGTGASYAVSAATLFPSGNDFPVEHGSQSGREDFPSHPSGAQSHRFAARPGLDNIKAIKRLRGGDLQLAARANLQIDAEIGQKDHFRMETNQDARSG